MKSHFSVLFPAIQTADNSLIMNQIQIHKGVCLHNGIVYQDKDEWTVDSCTHCTCQVQSSHCSTVLFTSFTLVRTGLVRGASRPDLSKSKKPWWKVLGGGKQVLNSVCSVFLSLFLCTHASKWPRFRNVLIGE